jgi:glyoxylase-like metal-dependent hydrolase (beta-lactamase superfamily II)
MILRQFLHRDPVAISYLLGCVGHGAAGVVDPLFPIEPYLRAAETERTPIRFVIDTHLHADHVSAGRALAAAAGAEYVLHASAAADFAFRSAGDGET